MTHNPSRIIFSIFILLIASQLPFVSTDALEASTHTPLVSEKNPDLLILLSPQYAHDEDITTAIYAYQEAVQDDLGWNSTLLRISEEKNTYQDIDALLENLSLNHPVKACIMVGEDLSTPLGGDSEYLEQPSSLPWSTLGGTTAYEIKDHSVVCRPTTYHLCISLLYPTHSLPYDDKKAQLVFAFHKFTAQRHTVYPSTIRVLESSDLNEGSQPLYQGFDTSMNLLYTEDASEQELTTSLTGTYSAYIVHGHSNPAGTDINTHKKTGWFTAENLDAFNTPFFGADGCYTAGWWSNSQDNDRLDSSIDATWYGSKIFSSPSIQVMALGLLSQNGFPTPVSFVENVLPELLGGETLAEAMIGDTFIGDFIIVGDPTFHFSI
jgi:hypothetical protein